MPPLQPFLPRQTLIQDTSRNSLPSVNSNLPSSTSVLSNLTAYKYQQENRNSQSNMASKLVSVSKLNRILFATPRYQPIQRSAYSSASSGDQKVQDDDAMTQGVDPQGETGDPKPDDKDNIIPTKEDDRYVRPKTAPSNFTPSKLQTPGVNTPIDPHIQQKRTQSTNQNEERLSCAGLDGSPWLEEESVSREEQEEDDKEYFKDHKASPLSKIEMGDTRKPLEKVAQATAGGYFGDEKVMTWLPEQVDTAEESLLRAMEMFREAAARGVPDWPHSRRLRELRGEDW
ncbi:hypothetical protein L1987_83007 [Smallanthus sonchifolius]|uniref:Uncharacterized protein n=1 Tax=Smallanthus sonchifolius TaxID=185202 RepID=A0ACB8YBF5_9ASTR|nr:hypothetical protein L1987_83007 [Smallanthus sonchifolius]